jgi:hypothetical protein
VRDWFLVSIPGKRLLYAATVFWSALLLLLVQPVLTKAILPWFGGSAGVWTTSMLFYQCLLLLGYAYAHFLARRLSLRMQVTLHTLLIAVSLLLLPLRPSAAWKPSTGDDPVLQILGLLVSSVGLPYFLLSATSPLVQSWFARNTPTDTPYRLFALSNLGSLVALLSYPAAIEPTLSTRMQMLCWTAGYAGFAALCCAAAYVSRRGEPLPEVRLFLDRRAWTWLALAACPSVLWLAVANQLSQDVAAVPFLWVVPLSLYLLSFVLCFDSEGWYRPRVFRWLLPVAWIAITMAVAQQGFVSLKMSLVILSNAVRRRRTGRHLRRVRCPAHFQRISRIAGRRSDVRDPRALAVVRAAFEAYHPRRSCHRSSHLGRGDAPGNISSALCAPAKLLRNAAGVR